VATTTFYNVKEAKIVKVFEHSFKKNGNEYTYFVNNGEGLMVQTGQVD